MSDQNKEVGKRITGLRLERGFTREKLSELADVSVQFLADIEKGRKSMTVATLRRICAALGVTTDYIVNGIEQFSENEHINTLLAALSPYHKGQAEKLVALFTETINHK